MFRTGKWAAAAALVAAAVWAGFAPAAQEPRPGADDTAVDLGALRDAVDAAARRGENVDEVRKALAALERARPAANAGRVPAELRALRDAVDAAAKKGENVEAIAKELEQVEKAVAGRALTRPRPEPARPEPNPFNRRDPLPFPLPPVPDNLGGGIDVGAFQKAMDVRMRALELLKKNPRDPEARRLLNEADELMLKALLPGGRGALLPLLDVPGLPDAGRAPERPRLGVRLEKVSPIVAEQLGLDANTGIAVTGIIPGSVAERIGLRPHDIILEFAGKPVSDDADAFIRRVNEAKAGEKLDLVVLRRGKKVDVKGVTLPEAGAAPRPANPPPGPVPPVIDSPVRADAPKPAADLGDLRDAVDAANRRGENVGEIRAALAALEKALAKGAARPGEAPPELAALREAVEAAARKGENVGAVSRELGLVE
ncbi:MAG: S1C family serine protease, partial [Gemmata sp.]